MSRDQNSFCPLLLKLKKHFHPVILYDSEPASKVNRSKSISYTLGLFTRFFKKLGDLMSAMQDTFDRRANKCAQRQISQSTVFVHVV